jgi:hypothetical protein
MTRFVAAHMRPYEAVGGAMGTEILITVVYPSPVPGSPPERVLHYLSRTWAMIPDNDFMRAQMIEQFERRQQQIWE